MELLEMEIQDPTWLAEPLLSPGVLTILSGPPKQGGKTTLLLAIVRDILTGAPFLGTDTVFAPVLYVTEQSEATFKHEAKRVGLFQVPRDTLHEAFHVLTKRKTSGLSWDHLLHRVIEDQLDRVPQPAILVLDTLPDLLRLTGEDENVSSRMLEALEPLQTVTQDRDLATLVVWHDRKAGGSVVTAVRGSGAIVGKVDQIVHVTRRRGRQRLLEFESRLGTFPPLLIEPDGEWIYRKIQHKSEELDDLTVMDDPLAAALVKLLAAGGPLPSIRQLEKELKGQGLRATRSTISRRLQTLHNRVPPY